MTLGALLTLFAAIIFVGGLVFVVRTPQRRTKIIGALMTFALTAVVGWLAWAASTVN
jgi:hypothetical protein